MVKAKVLDIDIEKELVSLCINQLESDPIEKAGAGGTPLRKGKVVTGTITEVNDGGIEVEQRPTRHRSGHVGRHDRSNGGDSAPCHEHAAGAADQTHDHRLHKELSCDPRWTRSHIAARTASSRRRDVS